MSTQPHVAALVAPRQPGKDRISFTYRCCGDPRTDSDLVIYEAGLNPAAVAQSKAVHQANVEARHEAKLAVEAQLAGIAAGPARAATDSAGGAHTVAIVRVEHCADEIVRVWYRCCNGAPEQDHPELIDHIPWHTADEISALVAGHMKVAAARHAVRQFVALSGGAQAGGPAGV